MAVFQPYRPLDRIFVHLKHPRRQQILMLVSENNPEDEADFGLADMASEDDAIELRTVELYHEG